MPIDDPISFGTLGRRRRRLDLDVPSFRARRDETAPPPDLEPYWPEAQQIEQSKTEYENAHERPLWARLLNVPSILLGGETIKGAIRGGAEGGLGGAITGAFRGSPIAGAIDIIGDIFGDDPNVFQETDFSQIRKALGQTNVDEGGANFAINLMGDILLDPVTYLSPLGFLKRGAASAGVAAAKGLTLAEQVAGEAIIKGEKVAITALRGGLVFRVPLLQQTGFDILPALAKLPLPYFDKFKSLNVQFAKGMDELFGMARTSPVLGPLLQKFGAVAIRDPKAAATVKMARILSREDADVYVSKILERYHTLPEDLKAALQADKDTGHALIDLMESGLMKLDNEGLITDYMKRLPQVMRNLGFKAAWKRDDGFRKLWQTAAKGDTDEAVGAIQTLYKKYDYFIPKKWLDEAGLPPRLGIDVDAPDTLAGGIGEALAGAGGAGLQTAGEVSRATQTALARGVGEIGQQSFRAQQEAARVARFKSLWAKMDSGEIDKAGVEELLTVHKEAMEAVGKVDSASRVINGMLEPYFPRIVTPGMKRFIDQAQEAGMKRLQFAGGKPSFAHQRKLTDMTSTEADAFLMEIGSKVTGFEGLNVPIAQFKRELAEHGGWAVLNRIYPQAFVRKLNRVDEELGSFFMSNPILADYWRIRKSGEIFQKQKFFEYAFGEGSPLLLDEARFADPKAVMSLVSVARSKGWSLNLIGKEGMLPKPQDTGDIITQVVGKDLRARIGIQSHNITKELNEQLADHATTFDQRLEQYGDYLKIGNKSDLAWSNTTPYAEAMLKRSIGEKLDAGKTLAAARTELAKLSSEAAAVRKDLSAAAQGKRALLQKDIDGLLSMVESDKARLQALAEGPLDWKEIDAFNAEVSKHVDAIRAGESLLSEARQAKRGIKTGKARLMRERQGVHQLEAADDLLQPIQERVLSAANQLQRARAQEFSVRMGIKHTVENMRTAQREVIGQKIASVGAKKEALREAMARLSRDGLKAEMVSNEAKLWWRFRNEGTLGWDEIGEEAQARMLKAGGDARLVAMHPDTLEAAKQFHRTFTAPDTLKQNPLIRVMDSMRTWFVGMTVMHPAMVQTRARDVIGGLWSAASGGFFDAGELARANRWSMSIGKAAKQGISPGEALGAETVTRIVNGVEESMSGAAMLQEMQRGGLVGADLIRDSLLDVISETAALTGKAKGVHVGKQIMDWSLGALGFANPKTNPVLRVGQKFARWGDDTVRIQTFLSAWKQGQSVPDALRTAMHWTYGTGKDVTSFERYGARRFIPFFGFAKWAFQRSAEQVLTKPGTVNWLSHVRDNAYNSLGLDSAQLSAVLPKFINDNLGIPVANTPEGPKMLLFGSMFPLGQTFDLVNAVSNIFSQQPLEGLRYIGQQMHPALKGMAEFVVNRDFYSGRDIEQFPGDKYEFLGVEMPQHVRHVLKSWFRGLSELDRLNVFNAKEMRVAVDAVRRGDVLGRRKELPVIERFLSSAFGPVPTKGYQIDVEEELRFTRRTQQAQLAESKALLRKAVDEGKIGDVAALQEVISDEIATIDARRELARRFLIDEAAASRKKIRLVR